MPDTMNSEPWIEQAAMSLNGLDQAILRLRSPGTRALATAFEDHSAQLGGSRIRKCDFDPTALGRWLRFVTLYDVRDREDVVYRLVGETIKHRFDRNPTGRSYLDYVPESRRNLALQAFHVCAQWPCAMAVRTEQTFGSGRRAACEAIGIPLFEHRDDIRASYLLFVDQPFDAAENWSGPDLQLRHANLRERFFVDLGFGTPGDFVDLVPAAAA